MHAAGSNAGAEGSPPGGGIIAMLREFGAYFKDSVSAQINSLWDVVTSDRAELREVKQDLAKLQTSSEHLLLTGHLKESLMLQVHTLSSIVESQQGEIVGLRSEIDTNRILLKKLRNEKDEMRGNVDKYKDQVERLERTVDTVKEEILQLEIMKEHLMLKQKPAQTKDQLFKFIAKEMMQQNSNKS